MGAIDPRGKTSLLYLQNAINAEIAAQTSEV
jgi:hypothetical protein